MRFLRTVHKLKNGAVHKNETTVHMFEKTQWVCDEPASLTPESVLTGTKERREKLLSSFRANGFHGVVKLPLGFKNH